VPIEDRTILQDLKETTLDKDVVASNAAIYEESGEELKVKRYDDSTQPRTPKKLGELLLNW
jgi:hypothetical protein